MKQETKNATKDFLTTVTAHLIGTCLEPYCNLSYLMMLYEAVKHLIANVISSVMVMLVCRYLGF